MFGLHKEEWGSYGDHHVIKLNVFQNYSDLLNIYFVVNVTDVIYHYG